MFALVFCTIFVWMLPLPAASVCENCLQHKACVRACIIFFPAPLTELSGARSVGCPQCICLVLFTCSCDLSAGIGQPGRVFPDPRVMPTRVCQFGNGDVLLRHGRQILHRCHGGCCILPESFWAVCGLQRVRKSRTHALCCSAAVRKRVAVADHIQFLDLQDASLVGIFYSGGRYIFWRHIFYILDIFWQAEEIPRAVFCL